MCFRDMTFCKSDCTNATCVRHFGDKERAESVVWWGGPGAPIAFGDFSKDCAAYIAPKGDK